jgi:hypothetical protein
VKLYGIAAEGERPRSELSEHRTRAIGCVWELEVTDHERRAWLRHVLQRGDLEAYVADTFEGDV